MADKERQVLIADTEKDFNIKERNVLMEDAEKSF